MVVSIATIFVALVPFHPIMPEPGLDPSWAFATNEIVARGIAFGKDVTFTFGPYGGLYTGQYHPATDRAMVLAGICLAAFYSFVFLRIAPRGKLSWQVAFIVAICAYAVPLYIQNVPFPFPSRDALLASYSLALAVLLYRITCLPDPRQGRELTVFAILTAPIGLLPLIKGSFWPICAAVCLFSSAYLLLYRRWLAAGSVLIIPVATMLLAWVAIGQRVADLGDYFRWMEPIIFGYSDAMSYTGPRSSVAGFGVGAAAVLVLLSLIRRADWRPGAYVSLITLLFLFICFKAGFVRQDGHVVVAANALLLAAVWLASVTPPRAIVAVAVGVAFAGALTVQLTQLGPPRKSLLDPWSNPYVDAATGIWTRLAEPGSLDRDYDAHLASIREQVTIPRYDGTTDLYFEDQAFLLASGNRWAPRPVLQSYSAYTPSLANRDHDHLMAAPPENIVLRLGPIDGRLPSLDDGSSWPIFLNAYRPVAYAQGSLVLRRLGRVSDPSINRIHDGTHRFGETVRMDPDGHVIFAALTFEKTWLGRLISVLFRLDPIEATVTLSDRTVRTFRLIPGMTETGFILSPLVSNTEDLAHLFGNRHALDNRTVVAIRIDSSPFWRPSYTLRLGKVDMTVAEQQPVLAAVSPVHPGLPPGISRVGEEQACFASIDIVNGEPPAASQSNPGLVLIDGWLAGDGHRLPDATFVAIRNDKGETAYIRTSPVEREDVAKYFKRPAWKKTGYHAAADVSKWPGQLAIGLASANDGILHHCSQQSVSLLPAVTVPPRMTPEEQQAAILPRQIVPDCEAHIDTSTGPTATGPERPIPDPLEVAGWTTIDGARGALPKAVFVTLTDTEGQTIFIKASPANRPDVAAHFQNPSAASAGFHATIPTVILGGNYTLGLGRQNGGTMEICTGIALPISLPEVIR